MINIKISDEYLDIAPNTRIQRERNSPFFLSTKNGSDAIPAEVSYPFGLPLTDRNMRLLGYTDVLPSVRQKEFDHTLYDEINQITNGKLILRTTDFNLNGTNVGRQEANLLCNASAFFKLIEGKYLKDLTLGGARTYTWDGYNFTTGTGFWRHCHQTWSYADCDDGDCVFFPIRDVSYGGSSNGPNTLHQISGSIQLARGGNATSICPHIYLSYLLRAVFEENGYRVTGDIFNDEMFKKICLASFRGVNWCELDQYYSSDVLYYIPAPYSSITYKLNEHVPQNVGIGEFLVELIKFLPLGLEIDDNSRTCNIITLGQPTAANRLKDMTAYVSPTVQTAPADTEKNRKIYGLRRSWNTDGMAGGVADLSNINYIDGREQAWLPLPAPVLSGEAFRTINDAGYWAKEKIGGAYTPVRLGDATGPYEPANATNFIESNMAPLSTRNTPSSVLGTAYDYVHPICEIEGNWVGKPTIAHFGLHIAFYQGKNYPLNNSGSLLAPYASNTNNIWVVGSTEEEPEIEGTWSMAYKLSTYGMYDVWWKEWLKILAENDTLKTKLNLNLVDYLKLKWGDEILIENTSFFIKKITDTLPYRDEIDIEAVRWIRGND